MKSRRLIMVIAIPLLAAAGLLAYRYLPIADDEVSLPVVDGCALHLQACSVEFPSGGSMTFEISPRQPAPTDTLRLQASFDRVAPQVVGVRFKGVDMNMGYLEHFVYDLHQNEAGAEAVTFSGDAGVFACSSNLMQWLVLVQVQLEGTRYEVPFRFETMQRG
ncbi:MAG: hypothetical protein GY802_23270 [Gammaproteobacteria bacterium]|nr:hypothetical protein [Gammaproteobacteria bacterium]